MLRERRLPFVSRMANADWTVSARGTRCESTACDASTAQFIVGRDTTFDKYRHGELRPIALA
jgi:hypothetical protein